MRVLLVREENFMKESWMSSAYVAAVLANLDVPLHQRTPTGKVSVSEDILEGLRDRHPIIPLLLEYRHTVKLQGMVQTLAKYVNTETQAIHAEWLPTGVPTGRFRCRNPNLQQIPEVLRSAFIARPGQYFIASDYSQIELRILAACAKEPVLIDAFKAGKDPHSMTAAVLLGVPLPHVTPEQRAIGKTLNFAVIYGTGVRGLSHRLGVSQEKAQELLNGYFAAVPQLTRFLQKLRGEAEIHGYVSSQWGRRRPLPEIHSSNPKIQAFGLRSAVNGFAQSTSADIIKRAMIQLAEVLPSLKATMLLTLHDAVLVEVPAGVPMETAAAVVRKAMEMDFEGLRLTVTISVGPDWGHLSKAGPL